MVDEGFAVYVGRREVLSSEIEDFITHFIVTCDDKSSLAAAKSLMYEKGLRAAIAFFKA